MFNSSLLNQRMYNDSPQYLLSLVRNDTISIAEYIIYILFIKKYRFRNVTEELDYIEITDALEFKGVT